MRSRFTRLSKVSFAFGLVGLWVLHGQACSPALPSKVGKPGNNGGIYGGNRIDIENYGAGSSSGYNGPESNDVPAIPTHIFVHHGQQPSGQSCGPATPPSAAFVSGWISIPASNSPFYREGFCGAPAPVTADKLSWVQFHQDVLVYLDEIFVFYKNYPIDPVDLKIPMHLCRTTSVQNGFDVGTDVFVYQTKDGAFADMIKGEYISGMFPTRTKALQIPVRQVGGLVVGPGFSLDPLAGSFGVDIITPTGATDRIEGAGLDCVSESIPSPF